MNEDTNFVILKSLNELLEEHKKITHPYKKYEFDSTSYTLLLCDINKTLKENTNLKQVLKEIREYCNTKISKSFKYDFGLDNSNLSDRLFTETVFELQRILQIIDKALGGSDE